MNRSCLIWIIVIYLLFWVKYLNALEINVSNNIVDNTKKISTLWIKGFWDWSITSTAHPDLDEFEMKWTAQSQSIYFDENFKKQNLKNELFLFFENKFGKETLKKILSSGKVKYILNENSSRINYGLKKDSETWIYKYYEDLDSGIVSLDKSQEVEWVHIETDERYIFESDKDIKNYQLKIALADPKTIWAQNPYFEPPYPILYFYSDISIPKIESVRTLITQNNKLKWDPLATYVKRVYEIQKIKYTVQYNEKWQAEENDIFSYAIIPYDIYEIDVTKGINTVSIRTNYFVWKRQHNTRWDTSFFRNDIKYLK